MNKFERFLLLAISFILIMMSAGHFISQPDTFSVCFGALIIMAWFIVVFRYFVLGWNQAAREDATTSVKIAPVQVKSTKVVHGAICDLNVFNEIAQALNDKGRVLYLAKNEIGVWEVTIKDIGDHTYGVPTSVDHHPV